MRYGLHADHNPFYTTYVVDPPTVGMLHVIAAANPSLGSLRNSDRWDQALDLLRKGILYLAPQAKPLAQEKIGRRGHPLEEPAGACWPVVKSVVPTGDCDRLNSEEPLISHGYHPVWASCLVVDLTADTDQKGREPSLAAGMGGFELKSVSSELLKRILERFLPG